MQSDIIHHLIENFPIESEFSTTHFFFNLHNLQSGKFNPLQIDLYNHGDYLHITIELFDSNEMIVEKYITDIPNIYNLDYTNVNSESHSIFRFIIEKYLKDYLFENSCDYSIIDSFQITYSNQKF